MERSLLLILLLCLLENQVTFAAEHSQPLKLHEPETRGDTSVEQAIGNRRSMRHFSGSLALADVSQLLWAAQGVAHPDGYRAAPSAGALYPLEVYQVVGELDDLSAEVYHYRPREHDLTQLETAASGYLPRGITQGRTA